MLVSIDFEDFHHDLKRSLGLWENGQIKIKELWGKYFLIDNFLKNNNSDQGKYCTFFCTGILAKRHPDLIRKIADDGHEIACHYYYHDMPIYENISKFKELLKKSKNVLENAAGKRIFGFRAPVFGVNKKNPEQYQAIQELFSYDSSFYCSTSKEIKIFKKNMQLSTLKILPIYSKYFFNKSIRLGGTYMKIFPYYYSKFMAQEAIKNGFEPHVYLHPYEFSNSEEFRVKNSDLKKLGLRKSLYWNLRQNQWLTYKNETTKCKLVKLIKDSPLKGKLIDQIK